MTWTIDQRRQRGFPWCTLDEWMDEAEIRLIKEWVVGSGSDVWRKYQTHT